MSTRTKVQFHGVDWWSRPVFKQIGANRYYGSVDILFDGNIQDTINKCKAAGLVYFGTTFDDQDPMGTPANVEIVE